MSSSEQYLGRGVGVVLVEGAVQPEDAQAAHDLEEAEDGVHVTVLKDVDTLADPLVSERLLKIIKEYSS